jgi:hypothetical protein
MRSIALVFSALLPSVALAQSSAAPPLVDREAVHFNEIERGVNVGVAAGYYYLLHAPVSSGTGPSSPGLTVRVDLSYDFGERLSVGIFGMATANKAGSDYFGKSGGTASGDFSAVIPGATLRLNALGFADSQEVKRVWFYARGGIGYVAYWPTKLLPQSDVLAFVGLGIEYFTPMRHFSIAFEALGTDLVQSSSFGFALTPVVRYAF